VSLMPLAVWARGGRWWTSTTRRWRSSTAAGSTPGKPHCQWQPLAASQRCHSLISLTPGPGPLGHWHCGSGTHHQAASGRLTGRLIGSSGWSRASSDSARGGSGTATASGSGTAATATGSASASGTGSECTPAGGLPMAVAAGRRGCRRVTGLGSVGSASASGSLPAGLGDEAASSLAGCQWHWHCHWQWQWHCLAVYPEPRRRAGAPPPW